MLYECMSIQSCNLHLVNDLQSADFPLSKYDKGEYMKPSHVEHVFIQNKNYMSLLKSRYINVGEHKVMF